MKLKNVKKINYSNNDLILKNMKKTNKSNVKFLSIFMHKKLQYICFFLNKKFFNYSFGQLQNKKLRKVKFLKKSKKSIGLSINSINKKLNKKINYVDIFFCKNFNYKNYLWIKKYIYLIKPKINKIIITNNWKFVHKNKRRIKKKIYKNLLKNNL